MKGLVGNLLAFVAIIAAYLLFAAVGVFFFGPNWLLIAAFAYLFSFVLIAAVMDGPRAFLREAWDAIRPPRI